MKKWSGWDGNEVRATIVSLVLCKTSTIQNKQGLLAGLAAAMFDVLAAEPRADRMKSMQTTLYPLLITQHLIVNSDTFHPLLQPAALTHITNFNSAAFLDIVNKRQEAGAAAGTPSKERSGSCVPSSRLACPVCGRRLDLSPVSGALVRMGLAGTMLKKDKQGTSKGKRK